MAVGRWDAGPDPESPGGVIAGLHEIRAILGLGTGRRGGAGGLLRGRGRRFGTAEAVFGGK